MPKNKGKGGKNRRRGKNENEGLKRDLIYKEDGQEYARVERLLGNGRLEAFCFDNVRRLCHIRGKLRKKVWINAGDIILVGLRDYQDKKADVIMRYLTDEARTLKAMGEIPEGVQVDETNDVQFIEKAGGSAKFGDNGAGNDLYDLSESESDGSDEDDSDEELAFGARGNPNLPAPKGAAKKTAAPTEAPTKDGSDSSQESESEEEEEEDGEQSYRYQDKFGPDKFKKDKRVNHPMNYHGRGGKGKRGK